MKDNKLTNPKPLTEAQKAALAQITLGWLHEAKLKASKKVLNNLVRIGAIQARGPTADELEQGNKGVFYRKTQLELFTGQE